MEYIEKKPPRKYTVGAQQQVTISDCGDVYLEADEQLTFKTKSGCEYDLSRKDWGFYATPSLNGRLLDFNLRAVLIKNTTSKRFFVLLVEKGKEELFLEYARIEGLKIVTWLDNDQALEDLEKQMEKIQHG